MGGNPRWWDELEGSGDLADTDYALLSSAEVEDRVEEAAAFISVLDDLQPVDRQLVNMFAQVWRRIARVPPEARVRLLSEIEPGAVRSLWRASLARYVLPDSEAVQLLGNFSVLQDFPSEPGQVATYKGVAERWEFVAPDTPFTVDQTMSERSPRSAPWLRPNTSRVKPAWQRFTQHFFLHPRTRVLHARVVRPLWGPVDDPWTPVYCRVRPVLTLTPLESDAGADMTLDYQRVPEPGDTLPQVLGGEQEGLDGAAIDAGTAALIASLLPGDLPVPKWPQPPPQGTLSPFSLTERDYLRVAGPGVYVGCGYPRDARGTTLKDQCVYFLIVRVHT